LKNLEKFMKMNDEEVKVIKKQENNIETKTNDNLQENIDKIIDKNKKITKKEKASTDGVISDSEKKIIKEFVNGAKDNYQKLCSFYDKYKDYKLKNDPFFDYLEVYCTEKSVSAEKFMSIKRAVKRG